MKEQKKYYRVYQDKVHGFVFVQFAEGVKAFNEPTTNLQGGFFTAFKSIDELKYSMFWNENEPIQELTENEILQKINEDKKV